MKRKSMMLAAGSFILTGIFLAGCGRSAGRTGMYQAAPVEKAVAEMPVEEAAEEWAADTSASYSADAGEGGSGLLEENVSRKWIRNAELTVETQNFDELLEDLTQEIGQLDGYVENCSTSRYSADSTWDGDMTARVPADKLDLFLTHVSEQSNVVYRNETVRDVTLEYIDLDTHKKALLTERDRLLALLEKAESVEDLISIENRLSEVRYQLESMEAQLRAIDQQVSYSTVYINIREVTLFTPGADKSTWQEITEGFGNNVYRMLDGLRSLLIEFVIALPYFIVWGIVIILLIILLRFAGKCRKIRKEKKKQKKIQTEENAYEVIPQEKKEDK